MVPPTVLITGARAPIALELVRSFAHWGWRVVLADSLYWPLGRWSRAVARYVRVPPAAQQPRAFVAALAALALAEDAQLLIPCNEETFYLSWGRSQLPVPTWVGDFDLLRQLHHKHQALDLVQPALAVPLTLPFTAFNDWNRLSEWVFKPVFSRFGHHTLVGPSARQLAPAQANPMAWIAQERLRGVEVCVYSLWWAGQCRAFVAYQPQQRLGQGAAVVFAPLEHPAIRQAVMALGTSWQFTGALSFDLMLVADQPYFLECNPRGTSGLHFFGLQLAQAFLLDQPVPQPLFHQLGLKTPWLLAHPAALGRADFRQTRDVVWDSQDWGPFIWQGLPILELALRALGQRQGLLDAATYDIAYNGTINPR